MLSKRRFRNIQILVLATASVMYLGIKTLPAQKAAPQKGEVVYRVDRVIDGDTLKLSDGSSVRLIGIDTSEVYFSDKLIRDAKRNSKDIETIRALGRKASAFTKKLCDGKTVRLEFDVEKRDRYGRLLAYVYLADGVFVNARIIEEGYAQVMTVTPNVKHAECFVKLQQEARKNKKGLWAQLQ